MNVINTAEKQRRLLRPTKALREKIRQEERSTLEKRLAFPDPYYNKYLEDNQISGTCRHGGIVFQVYTKQMLK